MLKREVKAVELGNGVTGIYVLSYLDGKPMLKIFEESGVDHGAHCPTKDIIIYDVPALRDFLNEHCPKVPNG